MSALHVRPPEPVTIRFEDGLADCPACGSFRTTDPEACPHVREVLSLRAQGVADVRLCPGGPVAEVRHAHR